MTELLLLRAAVGGPLEQMEEAKFAGALDRCWHFMTDDEQDAVEKEFAPDYVPDVDEEPNAEDRAVETGSNALPRFRSAA